MKKSQEKREQKSQRSKKEEKDLKALQKALEAKEKELRLSLQEYFQQVRKKLAGEQERLSILEAVVESINTSRDIEQLLAFLLEKVTKAMKAKDSSLVLVDEATRELVFKIPIGEKGEVLKEFRLKQGQGIVGRVVEEGEPVFVTDVTRDNRFFKTIDIMTGFETKSILCAPIKVQDKIVGAIEILNAPLGATLDDKDKEFFLAAARLAAFILEKERLLKEFN